MPVEFVAGDLFANRFIAQALAHGCNCAGSMGAGIAVGFRERYPAMFEEYRSRCKATPPTFALGSAFLWREAGKPAVFNLGTQPRPGRGATYEAVETALSAMRATADAVGVASIAMPRIAAGYGGLSWKKVKVLIETVFGDWTGSVYVYEEFREEAGAAG
ncbi:Appr-1-p processing domain protein OS=Myxococcus sp. (contaminant ex DSM 436) GN=A176_01753 PE=4 SV=1: Macro [Gemmataceae bacterium]|nr:Appr-1-p processing domain protein OS=Myxococcus sp. (contaminant ex DSM 436) GN=A176_01753 PE=4 SV=1: Macro [Gemmataceae bacterium]VTU00330.1 Appr-1-p processing domain protein OS=Myxococcus sp. (contaminant ex DSM 436) GN=A176_01753 PE=4 SV=1: Macro [Gemmataceae bacterium]